MNKIGDEGCKSLNRADWKKIRRLILSNHINDIADYMIGDEGCK